MKNIFLIFCFVIAFSNSAYSETKIFSCTEWNLDNPLKDDDSLKYFYKNKRGVPFIGKKFNREYGKYESKGRIKGFKYG